MYQALEVQNIDEILPPPPQPQPLDPAIENARALMGELLKTFPDQNHDAHIAIHVMYMKTSLVMTSPQVMATLQAHILEHVSQKARQMVIKEIEDAINQATLAVQAGAIDPTIAQQQIMEVQTQAQNPAEMEIMVSIKEQELLTDLMQEIMPPAQDPMSDPLVQIRMQELALKQEELQRKTQMDQAELSLEGAKMQQQSAAAAARIESQEQIADERNEVNRERIDVQRQAAQRRG